MATDPNIQRRRTDLLRNLAIGVTLCLITGAAVAYSQSTSDNADPNTQQKQASGAVPATPASNGSASDSRTTSGDWVVGQPGGPGQTTLTRAQIDTTIVEHGAVSTAISDQLQAVDYAARLLDSGEITRGDTGLVLAVAKLATQTTRDTVRAGNATMNDFPSVRARAVDLLDRIGGSVARSTVLDVLEHDSDSLVRAEAVHALADLADSPTATERQAITLAIQQNNLGAHDDYLAYAAVSAVETIYLRTRRPAVPGIAGGRYIAPELRDVQLNQALVGIALGPFAPNVRAKALELIRLMDKDRS